VRPADKLRAKQGNDVARLTGPLIAPARCRYGIDTGRNNVATILFFGRLGDQFGRAIDVELPGDGCTVGVLRALLLETLDGADETLSHKSVRACVDQEIVSDDAFVRAGQEIAFLPPLSGG
jgi:molybdopterin synthase sulfur carrier subunit